MGYRVKSLHLPRKSTLIASAKHWPSSILHANMKVKAKKELGQHFLTDESIAQRIVDAALETLSTAGSALLEIGPGTGVLTKYLLAERDRRPDFDLKLIEIDPEAAAFLRQTYPSCRKILYEEDFLQSDLSQKFTGDFCVVGNFPYNISSQIFFKLLDFRDRVPAIVGMLQKEVAERLASKPGKKAYGVLSVLLQVWYDIDYLFEVGNHCFNPQPKVQSAVIRLRRNSRTELPCDEMLFKKIVKTGFNQRRKTLRNSLRPLLDALASGADVTRFNAGDGSRSGYGTSTRAALAASALQHSALRTSTNTPQHSELGTSTSRSEHVALDEVLAAKTMDLRPEQLSVEDYIALTNLISKLQ
jgi:16S rRNA (adenine1518-N6/adenine1519-N6)-dimethyltransferase